jgi:peptidoglycan/xylan/chitin deacetylase (PgdA/CDA1 family)
MHGLDHKKWEADGITYYEFKNTAYEYQKSHMEQALELVRKTIPVTLVAFGAPHNKSDENTVRILDEIPDIKIWLYGPHNTKLKYGIILEQSPVRLEPSVGNPDFDEFTANYEQNLGLDYIVLQGHPGAWDDHDFNEFERIINYLKEKGSIFMKPIEYYYATK